MTAGMHPAVVEFYENDGWSVNQSINGGRWVSLGTYQFLGTSDDYVALENVTSEQNLTRMIAFDAMKWEPR